MVSFSPSRSRSTVPKCHDRYLIYRLIGRKVTFASPSRRARQPVSGVVEDVCRNIFTNEVEVAMQGGKVFRFPEPTAMVEDTGDVVVFMYGDVGRREDTDDEMFKEMRAARFGENVNDVLRRTAVVRARATRFVPEEAGK